MGKVTVIPATRTTRSSQPLVEKRKVAGYARVSTDSEEQATSYEAQVAYYKSYIKGRDDWEYVDIYTDEGISATNTRKRDGFNRMIKDALEGKIDLIITKSVSRFARNTVDSLSTVRQLKEKGIEIYFEKENIWTLDSKGELLITIMSSLAQEESRSISENVKWGQRKRFADGKVSFAYDRVLGFDKDKETGKIVIVEEQAKIVRLIYKLFIDGHNPNSIAKELTRRGYKTPSGKDKWCFTTVKSILTNEKYKGDALLQKSFTVDFLQKKMKKNEGEVPQYYIEGNHEAIISPDIFDWVQVEIKNRKVRRGSIFAGKIKCADCGGWYGAKVHHSNDKYRKKVYQCNDRYKGEKCKTPIVREEEVKQAFVKSFNKLVKRKKEITKNADIIIEKLSDTSGLKEERQALEHEISVLRQMADGIVRGEDRSEYARIIKEYDEKSKTLAELNEKIAMREDRIKILSEYKKALNKNPISEFDDTLWGSTVDYVMVDREKHISVYFRDGNVI